MSDLFNILRVCDEANATEPLTTSEVLTALRIAIAAGMGEYATQLLATFVEMEGADAELRESTAALIFNQATANPGIHKTH
ncbi:hypothetical protein ASC95_01230 [Pelomonas sp. Root1217]|uniref:hypothetical protein n=1 Tax=Pelomonas sp. Root1217 TaxID=1736430 RepID=UPI00070F6C17|nr:hypothetical protein [Pelomonas sp. Root1217]KQV60129.1 hypothetical protein ASC95_01230 [Pelomonas sp. Root1217]